MCIMDDEDILCLAVRNKGLRTESYEAWKFSAVLKKSLHWALP
jgi:hypothetical protein